MMNNNDSILPPQQQQHEKGSFLQRAKENAERNVKEWIRKALREAFLQAFQQRLEKNSSINMNIVKLSTHDWNQCMFLVQKVSEAWQEELGQTKHSRTADWVHAVWDSGRKDLWSSSSSSSCSSSTTQQQGDTATSTTATTSRDTAPAVDQPEDDPSAGNDNGLLFIPYCHLRKLGRPTAIVSQLPDQGTTTTSNSTNNTVSVLSQLQALGKQGASYHYWPLDHQIVDDTAKTIPKRQRWEQRLLLPGGTRPSLSSNSQDKQDDDNTENDELEQEQREEQQSLVHTETVPATTNQRIVVGDENNNIIQVHRSVKRKRGQSATPRFEETPRRPSSISSAVFHVDEELTVQEKNYLDRLIHHHDEDTTTSNTNTIMGANDSDRRCSRVCIFGALQNVGTIHAGSIIQQEQKAMGNRRRAQDKRTSNLTEKQRRRQERAYIKERLAPHRIQKNQDPQKYRSKVLRTEQECQDAGGSSTKNFLEFDLGWSLLEFEERGEKQLMAFSSIQASIEEPSPAGLSARLASGTTEND